MLKQNFNRIRTNLTFLVISWNIHTKLLFACTKGLQPILVFHQSYLIIFQFNHSTHRLINKLLIQTHHGTTQHTQCQPLHNFLLPRPSSKENQTQTSTFLLAAIHAELKQQIQVLPVKDVVLHVKQTTFNHQVKLENYHKVQ